MTTWSGHGVAVGGRHGRFLRVTEAPAVRRGTSTFTENSSSQHRGCESPMSTNSTQMPDSRHATSHTLEPVTLAALILLVWIALSIVVLGILNVAKLTVRAAGRHDHVGGGSAGSWPAPRRTTLDPTPAVGMLRTHAGAGRVDVGPPTPR